jgi:hypothetical protein
VASAFVDAGFPDPRQSQSGAPSHFLQRLYRCYRVLDKNVTKLKAITASILVNMLETAQFTFSSPAERAASELAIGAFFFAMRSCEYSHVTGSRHTKPLCLRNLRFFKENKVLPLSDPQLASATAIAITFEFQKTDVRSETFHQHSTGLLILCPIRQWSSVVQRILGYLGCDSDGPVSTVISHDQRKLVTGAFMALQLCAAAACLGEDVLGFSPDDIGTHSLRSAPP